MQWVAWVALISFGAAFIAGVMKRWPLSKALGALGVVASALAVFLVCWQTGRPPLLGTYETIVETVFLLGALTLWSCLVRQNEHAAATWGWGFCAAMLVVVLIFPGRLTPDSFMFDYPWLILFFQLRMASMALLLFAAALYLAAWGAGDNGASPWPMRRGKAFILAGWAAFLASEYSGATWSYYWLGDFWHWNAGFLESTLLFLIIAVPLHLPRPWMSSRRLLITAGAIPGLVVTTVTFIHQVGRS